MDRGYLNNEHEKSKFNTIKSEPQHKTKLNSTSLNEDKINWKDKISNLN